MENRITLKYELKLEIPGDTLAIDVMALRAALRALFASCGWRTTFRCIPSDDGT